VGIVIDGWDYLDDFVGNVPGTLQTNQVLKTSQFHSPTSTINQTNKSTQNKPDSLSIPIPKKSLTLRDSKQLTV
jgi:hypothetical protein